MAMPQMLQLLEGHLRLAARYVHLLLGSEPLNLSTLYAVYCITAWQTAGHLGVRSYLCGLQTASLVAMLSCRSDITQSNRLPAGEVR